MEISMDSEIKQMIEAWEHAATKRGKIIDFNITIENTLTDIITWCFYPSKYSSGEYISDLLDKDGLVLKSLLLRKIEFREKIKILKDVIIAKKPHIAESYKALISTIVEELNQVREFRNLLAHSESDISSKFLSSLKHTNGEPIDKLQLIEYKKGKVIKHLIDKRKYLSETKIMLRVFHRLWQLFALLNDDSDSAKETEELVALLS